MLTCSLEGIEMPRILKLRWYLFCKHMAGSDKLPTMGALKQHAQRVHVQAKSHASVAHQEFIDPGAPARGGQGGQAPTLEILAVV